ncbi:MAG: hypothetical protein P4L60_03270, partial [Clostridium sp.]|nr:hypothetical protein [Clostridium sp.]
MEKPILFNTEMVKAILDGKKTTTRRIIKDVEGQEFLGFSFCSTPKENEGKAIFQWNGLHRSINHIKPPYNVGDILYVRETWIMQSMSNFDKKAKFLFKAKPNEKLKEVILSSDRYEE